jgi:hypothetical protein
MKRKWLKLFGEFRPINSRPEQFLTGLLAGDGETARIN